MKEFLLYVVIGRIKGKIGFFFLYYNGLVGNIFSIFIFCVVVFFIVYCMLKLNVNFIWDFFGAFNGFSKVYI